MRKTLILTAVLIASIGGASAQTSYANLMSPSDGEVFGDLQTPIEVPFEFNATINEQGTIYVILDDEPNAGQLRYDPNEDVWFRADTGNIVDYEDYTINEYDIPSIFVGDEYNYQFTETLEAGRYRWNIHFHPDGNQTPLQWNYQYFQVTERVDGVEDRREYVDGGLIDDSILTIANTLGTGLDATRMFLGFILSLIVGLMIGFSNNFGSPELASVGFGTTFMVLMFIGLVPMLHGVIFLMLLLVAGYAIFTNKPTKVVSK